MRQFAGKVALITGGNAGLKAGRTVPLGDERYFWFGMSVARETGLIREMVVDAVGDECTRMRGVW
jgi:hypothetical protein